MKSGLEFGSGEWDAMLATLGRMHGASVVYRWALIFRAWVAAAREGPAAALPLYADLASRSTGDAGGFIASRASLAAGLAQAGQLDAARAHLAALSELIAPYRAGAGELDTPRTLLGGPAMHDMLIAAGVLREPRWIDIAVPEIRAAPLGASNRHSAAAMRALLTGDAAAGARELEAAFAMFDHVGFAGNWNRYAVACVWTGSDLGLQLRGDWLPLAARIRAFAERAGAKWWLKVLEDAGL